MVVGTGEYALLVISYKLKEVHKVRKVFLKCKVTLTARHSQL